MPLINLILDPLLCLPYLFTQYFCLSYSYSLDFLFANLFDPRLLSMENCQHIVKVSFPTFQKMFTTHTMTGRWCEIFPRNVCQPLFSEFFVLWKNVERKFSFEGFQVVVTTQHTTSKTTRLHFGRLGRHYIFPRTLLQLPEGFARVM